MERIVRGIMLILLIASAVLVLTVNASDAQGSNELNKTVTDAVGITYKIRFHKEKNKIALQAVNKEEANVPSGYNIVVDNRRVYNADLRLEHKKNHTKEISITSGLNVNQDNHTVTFETYGNSTQFNFTREINSSSPKGVPRPHISNVEVANGKVKGKPSAVAKVTLVNPSDQIYSTKLFVHTVDTEGSLYPASVRPGDTRTITVELLDERGSKIAGEARLYTGNLTTKDGAMDQVEFAGQAGKNTRTWNTSYEPVRPTWMNDHYQYHNDSYARSFGEKVSGGYEVGDVPLAYVGLALLVGFVFLRRVR